MTDVCGFASYCGRVSGHRGQHGNWKTGIRAQEPGTHDLGFRDAKLGSELSEGDVTFLGEIAEHGSIPEAARCLGVSVHAVKKHVMQAHARTGKASTIETFRALGWLQLPKGVGHAA